MRQKIALFADGDFWHGYGMEKRKPPNRYWREKIRGNMERDRRQGRELRMLGWRVLRFWEHAIRKSPDKVLAAVIAKLV